MMILNRKTKQRRSSGLEMHLTDHQLRLLEIVDEVRWGEEEKLNDYKYHLLRRALGEGDGVIAFEMEQAVSFRKANREISQGPDKGPDRSPWMKTWLEDPDT